MAKRNPVWTREEIILALDLYFSIDVRKINGKSREVIKLSKTLQSLPIHAASLRLPNFRSPDGVVFRLLCFAYLDPKSGIKGVAESSKLDRSVFNEFSNDIPELRKEVFSIRSRYKI